MKKNRTSRREFLEGTAGAVLAGAAATAAPAIEAQTVPPPAKAAPPDPNVPRTTIPLTVNGASRRIEVEDRWTLVELLRDHLGLTGTTLDATAASAAPAPCWWMANPPIPAASLPSGWMAVPSTPSNRWPSPETSIPCRKPSSSTTLPCGFCTSGQLMSAKALLFAQSPSHGG